ncbi:hypothetical protein, partial [Yoonia sp.]|uniref:hypothetical protein n=1 Tax=Yoonia sp. TaxID=2212373 RepID=UPI002600DC74
AAWLLYLFHHVHSFQDVVLDQNAIGAHQISIKGFASMKQIKLYYCDMWENFKPADWTLPNRSCSRWRPNACVGMVMWVTGRNA